MLGLCRDGHIGMAVCTQQKRDGYFSIGMVISVASTQPLFPHYTIEQL